MAISPNTTSAMTVYALDSALTSTDPFVFVYSGIDPTIYDYDYPIQKIWINFALNKMWVLYSTSNSNSQTTANWVLINSAASGLLLNIPVPFGSSPVLPNSVTGRLTFTSADGSVTITGSTNAIDFKSNSSMIAETITGDDGVVVTPLLGNINILGLVVANGTHAKAVFTESPSAHTEKIDIQVSAAIAATDVTKVGLSAFDSGSFGVDASGFVTLLSAFTGVTGLIPDAHTAPGTSPILPTSGNITITGTVTVAGHTPFQTNSLAAHTMELQIQTASAVPSTDATTIGLAAFNNTQFTVDGNGFVSISDGALGQTITGNSGGALSPTAGNWNIVGTGSTTTVGSGSTLTVELTGLTSHNVLIGSGSATITKVAPSATSGVPLISQGAASDPVFGTTVVAGGGTGNTTFTAYSVITAGTTATGAFQNVVGLGTSGYVLTSNGAGALPSWQASGAGSGVTGLIPDTHMAPGTSPVAPSGGNITITGSVAAAASDPVFTDSLAANTLEIFVQTSQAIASTDATKVGLASFSSAQFSVDANGFVTIIGGTGFTTINVQTFTSTGTYTPTAGMKYCIAEVVGGGGGGGGAAATGASNCAASAGGGGGGYSKKVFTAIAIGASQAVTIGAAGAAGVAGNNTGGTGGTTSFGALISATGGFGGAGAPASVGQVVFGGLGGTGSGGNLNITGGVGNPGIYLFTVGTGVVAASGLGAASFYGGSSNSTGTNYGGGGTGIANTTGSGASAGLAGGPGIVIVTEYI